MSTFARFAAAALMTVSTGAVGADEFHAGDYHDTNCTRCHGNEVYTREDRRVNSLPALDAQVKRCDSMLETQLFPDDIAALVDHLNDNFYKFQK